MLACLRVLGDAVPAAAAPAAPVAAAVPAAPAAAAPAAAGVDVAALAAVQRGVEDLRSASLSSAADLKAAQQATDSKVAALTATVEQGLQKLYAADAAQTAADEAQSKAAAAAGSSSASSSEAAAAARATQARLESVEKELADLKKMLASFVSAAPKSSDSALAEIKAQNVQILAQLANATAAWSFPDLESLKVASYSMSSKLTKFAQKSYASFMANYPSYAAQARELALQGADHAQVLGGQAQQLSADAHLKLSQLLQANGVPKEFVQYAALSVLGLAALLLAMLLWSVLKCLCRCCCCRAGKAAKAGKPVKASK